MKKEISSSKDVVDFYDNTFFGTNYNEIKSIQRDIDAKVKASRILNIISNAQGLDFVNAKILDCGGGGGHVVNYIEKAPFCNEVYLAEISQTAIDIAKERDYEKLVHVFKYDGYHIDYPDNFFDLSYCTHVLEHVEHPRLLMRELKRVSRYQVFEVPLEYSFKFSGYADDAMRLGHLNTFSPVLIRFLFKTEGFRILNESFGYRTLEELKKTEKLTKPGIMQKCGERVKMLLRMVLRLPPLNYLTDGLGYNCYIVLTK